MNGGVHRDWINIESSVANASVGSQMIDRMNQKQLVHVLFIYKM